jgi:DDE superfamily endonuclease
LIEAAYTAGERLGLAVWCADEAGPFQTVPYPGQHWRPEGQPARYPHEYLRVGTAKLLTLFHPATGVVRVHGVTSCRNAVLHDWLETELMAILAALPASPQELSPAANQARWERWLEGLSGSTTLQSDVPPLRMLLILDNLAGHKTPRFVRWLFAHGIMPLYTPLGGSWLNMTESVQRILKRRGLAGQHPKTVAEIITSLEAAAAGWNAAPTPFEWGGRRRTRRQRSHQRRHALGGSGACTRHPVRRPRSTVIQKWRSTCQMTH